MKKLILMGILGLANQTFADSINIRLNFANPGLSIQDARTVANQISRNLPLSTKDQIKQGQAKLSYKYDNQNLSFILDLPVPFMVYYNKSMCDTCSCWNSAGGDCISSNVSAAGQHCGNRTEVDNPNGLERTIHCVGSTAENPPCITNKIVIDLQNKTMTIYDANGNKVDSKTCTQGQEIRVGRGLRNISDQGSANAYWIAADNSNGTLRFSRYTPYCNFPPSK